MEQAAKNTINTAMLAELTDAFGPSGFEEDVVKVIAKYCDGLDVKHDAMHNVYASMKDRKGSRPVFMLDAHSDELGLMIQSIEENGLLNVIMLGGFHLTSLPAHTFIVRSRSGKRYKGITVSRPVHFLTDAQRADNSLTIEEIRVDVGASTRQEVEEQFDIHVGDVMMPDVTFEYQEEQGLCFGKAFDNRMGCACIIETMQRLKGETDRLHVDLVGAFAAQEEVGMRGATVTSQVVKPDFAIVFEGSPADDPYFRVGMAQGALRKGTQIRHMDKSYITNPEFIRYAQEIGEKYGIPYQDAVRRGGSTNAGKISLTNQAVPVLVLGIPSRYVHSHYNFCAMSDIEATVNMAVEVIRGFDEEKMRRVLRQDIL